MGPARGFTPDQVARYARHLILPEVGGAGQRKLLSSSVLLLGAGGLGSPAAMYLTAAGVGKVASSTSTPSTRPTCSASCFMESTTLAARRSTRRRAHCATSTLTSR